MESDSITLARHETAMERPEPTVFPEAAGRVLANARETAAGRKFADGAAMRPDPARLPELDRLGDQIAELSARIDAATCELLCHLREFDRGYGWEGFRSCAHWLNWRTGLDLGAAREKLRVATALADLNHVSAAMARGQLSYSKVRALTRVATPATEARLLAVALRSTAAHVERLVRAWQRADCDAAPDAERERLASRALSMQVDEDGMVVLRGRLTPEVGAVLLRAVEAAAEQVPASETGEAGEAGEETTIAQRRADALGLVAESALAGGLDPGNSADRFQVTVQVQAGSLPSREPANEARRVSAETRTGSPAPSEPPTTAADAAPHVAAETWETRPAESVPIGPAGNGAHPDGNTMPGVASEAGRSLGYTRSRDSRSERPAIVAPDADLDADLDAGQAVIEQLGGLHVGREAARRVACDAGLVVLQHGAGGEVLDVGRRTRTVPSALRRALLSRDRGQCQFPGCESRRSEIDAQASSVAGSFGPGTATRARESASTTASFGSRSTRRATWIALPSVDGS